MSKKLKIDGATGVCAIWDDASDDLPFSDPLNHLDRLHFHSDLIYPKLVSKTTGTLSLGSVAADQYGESTHTLFAHGLSGTPWVVGVLRNAGGSGIDIALAGSVPVQMDVYGFSRWVHLGADATNVVLHESYCTYTGAGFAGLDLDWEVYMTDLLIP